MSKKRQPAFRLKKAWTIVIPEGTVFKQWPSGSSTFEHVLGIHTDACAYLRVDDDAEQFRPDLFEKIKE